MSETAQLLLIGASFVAGVNLFLCSVITRLDPDSLKLFLHSTLYLGTAGALSAALLSLQTGANPAWMEASALSAVVAGLFMAGFIVGAAALWAARRSLTLASELLLNPKIVWSVRCLTAATFLMVGVNKLATRSELSFFEASGYSQSFYVFICIFECICAVGLLFRATVLLSALALWAEMIGAIFTHFHNYFTRGFADPFGNSLDALRMLILLTYIGFVVTCQQQKHTRFSWEGKRRSPTR